MNRKKIPDKIVGEVMFKSDRECCLCNKRGDHIHHIDGNNSNNKIENLALLCFNCHDEASIKSSLRRTLTPETIRIYRDHKHKAVATKRENSLKIFNSNIKELTSEELLATTKSAVIIIEIEKIKDEYFSAKWYQRSEKINKLQKFSEHTNFRVALEVFNFLSMAANQIRGGMTSNVADSIFSLILDYFPYSNDKSQNEKTIELANQCVNIGFSMVYDSTIHFKDYNIAMYGLLIQKYIYQKGKQQKLKPLIDAVYESYNEIERTLQRPERNDLGDALELVRIFKADLEKKDLSFPMLPDNLKSH